VLLINVIFQVKLVPKEPSDFREALPVVDVLRSATTMCGAQCVMISGVLLMHEWPADNSDFQQLVMFFFVLFFFLHLNIISMHVFNFY